MVLRRDNSLEYKARLFFYGQMKKKCRVILFITVALVFFSGIVFFGGKVNKNRNDIFCEVKKEQKANNLIYIICLYDNEIIKINLENTSYGIDVHNENIYTINLQKHRCMYGNNLIVEKNEQEKTIKIKCGESIFNKEKTEEIYNGCIIDFDKSALNHLLIYIPEYDEVYKIGKKTKVKIYNNYIIICEN